MSSAKITAGQQRGFILVAVMWFLAAVTIVAGYFASQVSKSVESATQAKRTGEAMIEMAGTRAEVFFRLSTDDVTVWGIGVDAKKAIALDDRPYRGTGIDTVRFQDSRGLLNLNFPDPLLLGRLLALSGISAERHSALFDALSDYTDTDGLRRLNGAEAPEYKEIHLPPPPNEWLYSPHQLKSVYGWHQLNDLWNDGRFMALTTASRVGGFNPDTAPPEILLALAGKEHAPTVEDILRLRKSDRVLAREKAFALAVARFPDMESVNLFPGNSIRITQESPQLPWAFEISLTLTPMRDAAPWRVDYFTKIHVKSKTSDEIGIPYFSFGLSAPAPVGAPALRPAP